MATADALQDAIDRIEQLTTALEPFIALRDQLPSQMAKIIHKGVSGLTPIALTVTKDQFKAACLAISSQSRKWDSGEHEGCGKDSEHSYKERGK